MFTPNRPICPPILTVITFENAWFTELAKILPGANNSAQGQQLLAELSSGRRLRHAVRFVLPQVLAP